MSVFQSRVLFWPRQAFKYFLQFMFPFLKRVWKMPIVLSIEETIDKIIEERCSICRYGDGEFLFIIHKVNLPFQQFDKELHKRLIEILKSKNDSILVGLPIGYHSMENLTKRSKLTWSSHIAWTYPHLKKFLDLSKTYYNSSMTRPYVNYVDKSVCAVYFQKLMKIWEGREVLLVEGEKSRLGVGNNLFSNTKKIERILAPHVNAFGKYKEIIDEVKKHSRSKLILIALGPTATVLAYDLARLGFQAIDVGNVDIEYEWFIRGSNKKIKIPGKYSNEVVGGIDVEDIQCKNYETEVIERVL